LRLLQRSKELKQTGNRCRPTFYFLPCCDSWTSKSNAYPNIQ